jgi:hypothetical protein
MVQKRRKFAPVSKKAGRIEFDYAFRIGQNSMIKRQ